MKIKKYITEAQLNEWGNADDYTELGTSAIVNGKKPDGSSAESGKSNPESTSAMNDKRVDNINNDEGESKSAADNIEKVFDNVNATRPKQREKFKNDLAAHISKWLNLDNASQFIIKNLPPYLVQEFAKSIGKNALCYPNNLFLNMMNNTEFTSAVDNSKSTFERIYNLTLTMNNINNSDGLNWIKSNKQCILYLPSLWKNIDDDRKLEQIINFDFALYRTNPSATVSESLIIEKKNKGYVSKQQTINSLNKEVADLKSKLKEFENAGKVNIDPSEVAEYKKDLWDSVKDRTIDEYINDTMKQSVARTGNESEVALNNLKKVVASGNEDSLTGIFNALTKDEQNSKKMSQFIINNYKNNNANKDS